MSINIQAIKQRVMEIFESYRDRGLIEEQLELAGFQLWGYLNDHYGRPNRDEQIWAYDKGVPNGQVLVLVNWIEGFYWIYEKTDRGDLV
ncbi:hypothetical protein [Thermococcus prieurii]